MYPGGRTSKTCCSFEYGGWREKPTQLGMVVPFSHLGKTEGRQILGLEVNLEFYYGCIKFEVAYWRSKWRHIKDVVEDRACELKACVGAEVYGIPLCVLHYALFWERNKEVWSLIIHRKFDQERNNRKRKPRDLESEDKKKQWREKDQAPKNSWFELRQCTRYCVVCFYTQ